MIFLRIRMIFLRIRCHIGCIKILLLEMVGLVAHSCLPVYAVYDLDGTGRAGELKNFEKPWAMTTSMYALCLRMA